MRDSEIVAAIVGGNPDGLATAYDKYAAPLYTYCRAQLREPADAADAVQDTFVIAASRLAGLRDRERLRPWLYAVARNECHRIRAATATSALDEAHEVTDETAEVGSDAERAELRALLRAAVRGLNPAEQEVIELQLRQGLDGTEVADVLGITRNHAHALISRARGQLEICLGVLLVARTGRSTCAALNTLLEGWDGQLTTLLRKRLNRHVERCPVCNDRRRSALRPAMLLGLAPLAALPAGAVAPAGLRDQVLRLASSNRPEAIAHRASVAGRTGPFGQHGFPRPLDPPKAHWWLARPAQMAGVAATAAAVIGVTSAVLSGGNAPHHTQAAGPGGGGAPGAIATGPTGAGFTSPGGSPSGTTGGRTSPATAVLPSPGLPLVSTSSSGQPGPGPGPSSSSPGSTRPTSSAPTTRAPTSAAPSSPAPTTPAPTSVAPGTLTVSPTQVVLSTLGGTSVTISAVGGPVSWSISEASSLIGALNVSPAAGTLQAGQQVTVSITVSSLASLDTTLTVNPGGHTITVLIGLL
jgi:RNA polymerase sigma factor (sigma-70 family)